MSISPKTRLRKAAARWQKTPVCIIGVAGRRKAGKSLFVDYLKNHYPRFRHVRIADAPFAIAKLLKLPADREIYQALFGVNALLLPILKESVFKRLAASILDEEKPRRAVVEAIRTKEEYQEFIVKRGGILVGIAARPRIRYQRVLSDAGRIRDKQDEAKLAFREFIGDPKKQTGEYRLIEREAGWIVNRAHFIIENNYHAKLPFYREIDELMKILGIKKQKK